MFSVSNRMTEAGYTLTAINRDGLSTRVKSMCGGTHDVFVGEIQREEGGTHRSKKKIINMWRTMLILWWATNEHMGNSDVKQKKKVISFSCHDGTILQVSKLVPKCTGSPKCKVKKVIFYYCCLNP